MCNEPLAIQAKDSEGTLYENMLSKPVVNAYNTKDGFICLNQDQPGEAECPDFQVRFKCPLDHCATPNCAALMWRRAATEKALARLLTSLERGTSSSNWCVRVEQTSGFWCVRVEQTSGFWSVCEGGADLRVLVCEGGADLRVLVCESGADLRALVCEGGADLRALVCEGGADLRDLRDLGPLTFALTEGDAERPDPNQSRQSQCCGQLKPKVLGFKLWVLIHVLTRYGSVLESFSHRISHMKRECFTEWFDRDDPSGSGDWEKFSDLFRDHPTQICSKPIGVDAQTMEGLSLGSTRNKLNRSDINISIKHTDKYDLTGLVCLGSEQEAGVECADYKIRFLCPADFCMKPDTVCDLGYVLRLDGAGAGSVRHSRKKSGSRKSH
ncbi:hypothetical protein WMY93_028910 [Mugilogobius chulae]|uniref:WxxW domain-containing protein n=1 Tax=Mugilogobius chulae TaxID=88201 RepID=A0AAW0MVW5_9GOBI